MHSKVLKVIRNGCIGLGNTNLLFVAACAALYFFLFNSSTLDFFATLLCVCVCVAVAYRRDKMCWRHSLRDKKKENKITMSRVPVSRHYIPLGQRAGHLRVHKVGLELSFALDVDDASARAHVAQSEKDTAGLLRHLRGEGRACLVRWRQATETKVPRARILKIKGTFPAGWFAAPQALAQSVSELVSGGSGAFLSLSSWKFKALITAARA